LGVSEKLNWAIGEPIKAVRYIPFPFPATQGRLIDAEQLLEPYDIKN